MSTSEHSAIKVFCNQVDWSLQMWLFRKHMFDKNPNISIIHDQRHAHFFYRIYAMSQEYWLLQVAKLHDPATKGKNKNLTIDYIVKEIAWSSEDLQVLNKLKGELDIFGEKIKTARNKIISHHDFNTVLGNEILGEFGETDADEYFSNLIEFCTYVCRKKLDEPFVYDDLVQNDIEHFMACFEIGFNKY